MKVKGIVIIWGEIRVVNEVRCLGFYSVFGIWGIFLWNVILKFSVKFSWLIDWVVDWVVVYNILFYFRKDSRWIEIMYFFLRGAGKGFSCIYSFVIYCFVYWIVLFSGVVYRWRVSVYRLILVYGFLSILGFLIGRFREVEFILVRFFSLVLFCRGWVFGFFVLVIGVREYRGGGYSVELE